MSNVRNVWCAHQVGDVHTSFTQLYNTRRHQPLLFEFAVGLHANARTFGSSSSPKNTRVNVLNKFPMTSTLRTCTS